MRNLFLLLMLLFALRVAGQSTKITGSLINEANEPLPLASVVLLYEKDSVMHSFTIADNEGLFLLKKVKPGNYVLKVAFVGFDTWTEIVIVTADQPEIDMGIIVLEEKSALLDEVSITADRIPILIKGDTIEYDAESFNTAPNSSVEDLLRRLPGVEVDNDGNLKAQGEEVNKVLVDGKEFFGDDPKIATKNLPADAIDKVQVFDKMSETAEFTGVDDGQRSKTINLALKDDKKNGVFGKLSGGMGTDNRYRGKANINKFNKNTQLSGLLASNNVNEQNFSFQDYLGFSGGLGVLTSGGAASLTEGIGALSNGGEQGVSTATSGGLNFNHEFGQNTELTSSYFFNMVDNELIRSSSQQNFLNGLIFNSADTSTSNRLNGNHRLNLKLRHVMGEGQDLTLRSTLKYNNGENQVNRANQNFDTDGNLTNIGFNQLNRNTNNIDINSSILYRLKLNDLGRSISARAGLRSGTTNQEQDVMTTATIFNSTAMPTSINQFQSQYDNQLDYELKLSITEPLGGLKYLTAEYEHKTYATDNEADFFDIEPEGRIRNTDLSQFYRRDYNYDRGNLKFLTSNEKINFRLGASIQSSSLKGQLVNEGITFRREFLNFLPSLSLKFDVDNSKRLSFVYTTNINEPSLRQLQPVVANTNPLNQYVGNPNLKAEYKHDAFLSFNLFDNFSFTSLFLRLSGSLIEKRITNSTSIAEDLTQLVSPVNIDREWNATGYSSFGTSVKPLGIKFNISTSHTYVKTDVFINTQQNTVDRLINSVDFQIENRKKKSFDLLVGYKTELNSTKYSLSEDLDQSFVRNVIYKDLSIPFFKKWALKSSFDYRVFEGDAFEDQLEIPIWTASISRVFLKNDRGEIKLSIFDILNENKGVSRNSYLNFIQDQRVNTVTQYMMLTFIYSLSKFGAKKSGIIVKESGGR